MAIGGGPIGGPIGGGTAEILGADYVPNNFVQFSGVDTWLGPVDTSGLVDEPYITASLWFIPTAAEIYFFQQDGGGWFLRTLTGAPNIRLHFGGEDSTGSVASFNLYSFETISPNEPHHFLASVDVLNGVAHMYVDNLNVLDQAHPSHLVSSGSDIDWTRSQGASIGSRNSGTSHFFDGAQQELWIAQEFIDAGVVGNREKFIKSGKPVSLGADGSLPTGTQPVIYLRNPYDSWEQSEGSLGNFAVNGTALTDQGTRPALLGTATTYGAFFTLDSVLQKEYTATALLDGVLGRSLTNTCTLGGMLKREDIEATVTIDGEPHRANSVGFTFDGVLLATGGTAGMVTISLDSVLISSGATIYTNTATIDAKLIQTPIWGEATDAAATTWTALRSHRDE